MLLIRENTIKAGIRRKRPFFVSFAFISNKGELEVHYYNEFYRLVSDAVCLQKQLPEKINRGGYCHLLGSVVNRCRKDGTWYEVAGTGLPR